jgi:orotidine-5'-phosphate decarboxylase
VTAPIAVALDAPDLPTMQSWALACASFVQCAKVGLEVFCRDGKTAVSAVREVAPDLDIFLDLKLHDIPATVRGACTAVADLRPSYLTVHASGGPEMIAMAVEALPDTRITAVTVLTSLDDAIVGDMGWQGGVRQIAVRLAEQSVAAGARAIVCSPQEVAAIRAVVPADITLITPGVRPVDSAPGDQRRFATPEQALADGADLLVIGRPITGQPDVGAAARAIAEQIAVHR